MIKKQAIKDLINPPGQIVNAHPLAREIEYWKADRETEAIFALGYKKGYAAAMLEKFPPEADNSENGR